MNFFLGQLLWDEPEGGRSGWIAPPDIVSFLDLRNLTQQATPITPLGFVLMAANREPMAGEITVADSAHGALNAKARDAVADTLGIPERLTAANLPGLIRILLGVYADPDVSLICPPLMPGHNGMLRFRLGDLAFTGKCPTSGPHWNNIVKVLQRQYRDAKENLPRNMHQRLLTTWKKKFRVEDHEVFIPADLPKEKPLPHETTVRDNFDVGNHADLSGQLSSDGDWSWTKVAGSGTALIKSNASAGADITISSGQYCTYRADKDLSSEDMYVQGIVLSTNDLLWPGLIARKDSSATETYYDVSVRVDTDQLRIRKVVAGIGTTLQNNAQVMALSTQYTVRLVVDGSTLQTFFEGAQVGADLTDTAITTGLRCGMGGEESGVTVKTGIIEDFEGGDWPIVIPPDPPPPYTIMVPYRTLDKARVASFTADDNMTPDFGPSVLTGEPTAFLGNGTGVAAYPMVVLRELEGEVHAIGERFTNTFDAFLWHKKASSPFTTWTPAEQHANKAGPLFNENLSGQCIGATVVRIPPVTGPKYLATFQAIGNGAVTPSGNIAANLIPLDGLPLDDSLTLEQWIAQCSLDALVMVTQSLPDATVGAAYTDPGGGSAVVRLVALGGQPPYTWSAVTDLPDGLSFDNSRITGTPTTAGAFTFTARVVDALGAIVTRDFTINIS